MHRIPLPQNNAYFPDPDLPYRRRHSVRPWIFQSIRTAAGRKREGRQFLRSHGDGGVFSAAVCDPMHFLRALSAAKRRGNRPLSRYQRASLPAPEFSHARNDAGYIRQRKAHLSVDHLAHIRPLEGRSRGKTIRLDNLCGARNPGSKENFQAPRHRPSDPQGPTAPPASKAFF